VRQRVGGGFGGTSQDRATWLALLCLLLAILAPAAIVIWFMNEAITNQADADRQRMSEAYRGQLRLVRNRIEDAWRTRAADLAGSGNGGPAAFHRVVTAGRVDSIVFFRADGAPEYPSLTMAPRPDTLSDRSEWRTAQTLEDTGRYRPAANAYAAIAARERDASLAARAVQAQVRSLVRARDTAAALRAIDRHFSSGAASSGRDRLGRLIAADMRLLALRLLPPQDAGRRAAVERLESLLNDYDRVSMPSAQRVFLLKELLDAEPSARVPTYAAERMALEFLEADGMGAGSQALEPSARSGFWKLRVGESALALFHTATVAAMARGILDDTGSPNADVALVAPGSPVGDEAIDAGALLPGWRISLSLRDARALQQRSQRRMATYLWSGTLAIVVLAVAGLLVWQSLQRQMRLTRLRTDLVAAVSHELRTPLASMRVLVDSLLDDEELDVRKTRDYLRLIAGENARLSRLIEHFLTFSRIERNRHQFAFAEVRPESIVTAAVNAVRPRLDAAQADFRIDVSRNLPPVFGDEDALATVLLNLLENACTYTRSEKRISLQAYRDGDQVVFEVEDNGIGIAPRDQKRVFRRFYQVDRRLSRESGGCGLGLSIVDFIVKAHGGAVGLRSEVGVGSTFRVSLPTHGQEATA
jgi:signal transduction histidine kinase